MEGSFEERVAGTLLFVRNTPELEVATFIVHQNDAIDGLRKNLEGFTKTFKEMYNKPPHFDRQKTGGE
jgi:hypothetical protein